MIGNYFKIAWRNLVRFKVYSAINIVGLAIGLAVCMLIVLYVGHESSYDQFHRDAGRTFWVQKKMKLGADSVFMPHLNYSAGPAVTLVEPAVESFLRMRVDERVAAIIQHKEDPSLKFAENKFLFADSNFFSFFSFRLLEGNRHTVLQHPMSVVLSADAAKKYFGNRSPVGQVIRYNNTHDLLVTGVAENAPSNSSIVYDFVASLSSLAVMPEHRELMTKERSDFLTYFKVRQATDILRVRSALTAMEKADNDGDITSSYISTPLTALHTIGGRDSSNLKYLKIFPFVAGLILLLALINYMSLSTARASVRSKEIGVRKVMGASRKLIAIQFFAESALFTAIAFLLGFAVCVFFQPVFFSFLEIDIDQSFLYHPEIILLFASLFLITVLLSGTYPSLLLSAFKPVAVLYGRLSKGGNLNTRKFFTVLQFSIAVVFIICGIVIRQQMHFFRYAETGISRDNVLMVLFKAPVSEHYGAFKGEIASLPGISKYSIALHPLYKGYDMMGIKPVGSDRMTLMPVLDVDEQFIPLLNLKWKQPPADPLFFKATDRIILNETAMEKLNVGASLPQKVDQFEVAGVLKDFHWSSLQQKIEGLLISVRSAGDTTALWTKNGGCLFAKVAAGTNIPTLIDRVKGVFKKYDDENPFEYYFMDDAYDALYKAEDRLSRLLIFFTGLAIVIACLGLLGLVTFMALQRTREIGIRKTLGASVQSIVTLLSGDFIRLVIIAAMLASPVAWYFMNKWLQDFAYRVPISWWVFGVAGVMAIVIALLTISLQAIRAAKANPVKSLRTE